MAREQSTSKPDCRSTVGVPTLTPEQGSVCAFVTDWLSESEERILTVGGYAGTGKTVTLAAIADRLGGSGIVVAPTGKASLVLRKKGIRATTIHSWLYGAPEREAQDGELSWGEPRPHERAKLVIVDEASMISTSIFDDLMKLDRQRFLFIGDHGQLQPVGGDPGLMARPDLLLKTILRQAAGSPIIHFAHSLRVGDTPTIKAESSLTVKRFDKDVLRDGGFLYSFDIVLVGFNRTRCVVNAAVRARLMYPPDVPVDGDRVVCLRNTRVGGQRLFNGQMGIISGVRYEGSIVRFDFVDDGETLYRNVPAVKAQFGQPSPLTPAELDRLFPSRLKVDTMGEDELIDALEGVCPESPRDADFQESVVEQHDRGCDLSESQLQWVRDIVRRHCSARLFDYAYAVTVHKFQGSEADNVLVIEERSGPALWDPSRWAYTAATRAKEKLVFLSWRAV